MFKTPETGKSIPYDHDSDKNFKFLCELAEAAKNDVETQIRTKRIINVANKHSEKHITGHHASYTDTKNCTEKAYDQWSNVTRLPMIRDRWLAQGDIAKTDTVAEFIRKYDEKGFFPGKDGYKTPDARIKTEQKWKEAKKYSLDYIRQKFNIDPTTTTMREYEKILETWAEKVGKPEIDNIRRELGLLGDKTSTSPTREPPSSPDGYVPPKPKLVNDTQPDLGDTLPGAEHNLRYKDSSKETGYATTEPASGSKLQAEIHYSRINVRTLGDECTGIVRQLGMTEQDLNDYLFIHEKASRLDGGWKEGALQKVIQAEVRKTFETLGPQLGKEMISFGHNPHSLSNAIDQMIDSGYDSKAILEEFKVEKKLAESLQAKLGGSRQNAKIEIKASDGDVTKAIGRYKWKQLVDSWNSEHSSSMRQMSTSEKQLIQKEADKFAKNEEKIAKNEVKNEVAAEIKKKNREQDELMESKEFKNGFKDRGGR
jgi:hypothetical protein